jgi:hypothetical protein
MRHTTASQHYSIGELAELLVVQGWRIARLFELGIVPEPPRVAGRRLIPAAMIPEIVEALRVRGWFGATGAQGPEGDRESD